MNDELNAVKVKISKLLALGTSNNSTAEAQSALQRASKLMEEWTLSIEDVELGDEDIVHEVVNTGSVNSPELRGLPTSLGKFLNVKVWGTPGIRYSKTPYKLNLLGYKTDVDMFLFFWDMLNKTFERDYKEYKNTEEFRKLSKMYHGRKIRASFRNGFSSTVAETLSKLAEENKPIKTKSGTALVPLKNGKIEQEFEERFNIKLQYKNSSRSGGTSATGAGMKSGSKVQFRSPVSGGSGPRMIAG